jgi:hypothetical protein
MAADGILLKAVGFALTGTDNANVQIIDPPNCVFGIGSEVFHLNNVEIDRMPIQEFEEKTAYAVTRFVKIELHGDSTVYENTTQLQYDPQNEFLRILKEKSPSDFEPKHVSSNEHMLRLQTVEKDRVIRAWQYIYSHGCSGKKSPF